MAKLWTGHVYGVLLLSLDSNKCELNVSYSETCHLLNIKKDMKRRDLYFQIRCWNHNLRGSHFFLRPTSTRRSKYIE